MTTLDDPDTPFLALDETILRRNVDRLRDRLAGLGVTLRAHVKTAKSLDVAAVLHPGGPEPITVSTLAEAEAFAAAGYTDILYAVGIAPPKLARVRALRDRGVDLVVLLDNRVQAVACAEAQVPALIEIDADGHRSGLRPDDPALLDVADTLGDHLRGVLVHAGQSYHADGDDELRAAAEQERATAVAAAERLRAAGHRVPVVSVGSTPTAHFAADLTGVTEVRAGNFVFFDLVMAGIGVCTPADLAISVVATVIGHQPDKGWIMTDGGWTATSRDRGTAHQKIDQGYGLVADLDGTLHPDLLMTDASQEHGVLTMRDGSAITLPELPVGTRVRILPNHACATAAQHDRYRVVAGSREIRAEWPRVQGW